MIWNSDQCLQYLSVSQDKPIFVRYNKAYNTVENSNLNTKDQNDLSHDSWILYELLIFVEYSWAPYIRSLKKSLIFFLVSHNKLGNHDIWNKQTCFSSSSPVVKRIDSSIDMDEKDTSNGSRQLIFFHGHSRCSIFHFLVHYSL